MSTLLWLDDERDPSEGVWAKMVSDYNPDNVVWVKNYIEFTSWIEENGLPYLISFDHDLADSHYAPEEYWDEKYNDWFASQEHQEKTGYDCAKWLVDYCIDNILALPPYAIHSFNPVGAENIKRYLQNYQNHCND